MSEFDYLGRLRAPENLEIYLATTASQLDLGHVVNYELIKRGFEDVVMKVTTNTGNYAVKLFSAERKPEDLVYFDAVLAHVVPAGVQHPVLYGSGNDDYHYVRFPEPEQPLLVMDWIEEEEHSAPGDTLTEPEMGSPRSL